VKVEIETKSENKGDNLFFNEENNIFDGSISGNSGVPFHMEQALALQ
jgi:hypothetical protein